MQIAEKRKTCILTNRKEKVYEDNTKEGDEGIQTTGKGKIHRQQRGGGYTDDEKRRRYMQTMEKEIRIHVTRILQYRQSTQA